MSTLSVSPASATRLRASSACGGESVIPVTWAPWRPAAWMAKRAPAAADVEQVLPGLEVELGAHELVLRLLRLLERGRPAREDRARVGHRRPEEEPEVVVGDVVVVAHRAGVALARVAPAARHELGRRARVGTARPGGAGHRPGQPRSRAAVQVRGLPRVQELDHGVHVVDAERPRHIGAAQPELAGRAQGLDQRLRRVCGERRAVGAGRFDTRPVPERDRERAIRQRFGDRLAQRLGGGQRHPPDDIRCGRSA